MEPSRPTPDPSRILNGTATSTANGGAAVAPGARPSYPAPPAKPQPYRPPYRPRPPPPRRRSRRRCCCIVFLWLILFLIAFVFILAIAAGVFYVIYHPQRPSFAVSSLRLSAFNLTASDVLTARLNLSVTVRNPNRKIELNYGDTVVSATVGGVAIGDGTIPGFTQGSKNTTSIKAKVASSGQSLDPTEAADLKRQLKKKRLPLEMEIDTKLGARIGGMKTKGVGIRVSCDGIDVAVVKGNATAPGESTVAKCKVKLRVKGVILISIRRGAAGLHVRPTRREHDYSMRRVNSVARGG